jgi:quinol monooxygenase YgiN
MYGLISKINAVPGQRDALAAILLEGTQAMPGCLSYVIASDPADDKALWITEVWDSQASHQASLSLPAVQVAVAKGRTSGHAALTTMTASIESHEVTPDA